VKASASLSDFLETFRRTTRWKLSKSCRLAIIDQALVLLEMNYVHLPLKRAMHAIDPISRLKLLRGRIEETHEDELPDELQFHQEMKRIFTATRDFHTRYRLSAPFNRKTAYLPFLIEEYFDKGAEQEPKFLVTKLAEGFNHPTFKTGVEVLYWNGMPIKRAIELNGENQPGSNPEARFANGLDLLTIRPLHSSLPPDEEWVVITYRSLDGQELEIKQGWWLFTRRAGEGVASKFAGGLHKNLGIDILKADVNEGRKILFTPEVLLKNKKPPVTKTRTVTREAIGNGLKIGVIETNMPEFFRVRVIETRHGKEFGYVRVFSFHADNTSRFVKEFVRLVKAAPPAGLIIDVRNNGGGRIAAGERLLQLFTPHPIKPELFQLLNTPLNLELSRVEPDLSPWRESMEEALETGAIYSLGFPLTSEESCNRIGQVYCGPVLLITDALCYSTTDMFAAGFSDHEVGTILGVSGNTGAGGANVWAHENFLKVMKNRTDLPYRPLPRGVSMGVAFRRSIRVGDRAGGRPLEDLGVVPNRRHHLTKADLLNNNSDLIHRATKILALKKVYCLSAKVSQGPDGTVKTTARTQNISRLDLYIDDRPQQTRDVVDGRTEFRVKPPSSGDGTRQAHVIMLKGFDGTRLVAALRKEVRTSPNREGSNSR
jgi:hypothetical protein